MKDQELIAVDFDYLVKLIKNESLYQIKKHGHQDKTDCEWLSCITEEIGELNKAVLDYRYHKGNARNREGLSDIKKEGIQSITLIVKFLEMHGLLSSEEKFCFDKGIDT